MTPTIFTSPQDLTFHKGHSYYQQGYFNSQQYQQFLAYSSDSFFMPADIIDNRAISIPRSPFGSIFCLNETSVGLESFLNHIKNDLLNKNVTELILHHPSSIYSNYPAPEILKDYGGEILFEDLNQHIPLNQNWEDDIHTMQKRKLKTLIDDGFVFRKMEENELLTAHRFLTVCRQAQGLQINIEWERLKLLNENLPGKYECFGVFRDQKISAVCISVNVTDQITYYYLPATSPMFRNQSPMVLLIAGMVEYYRVKGYKYLDLGISSIEGKPQEPLKLFKERMGGLTTSKPTLRLSL
ncbi:GNAT family N-acetyltransferase [Ekhidna sp.]|uniref:GNAT family N-acetyltransferase n=1 Tax=Ekhidna sp. TaxID=2608089 RepID=UPI003B50D0B8